MNGEGVVLGLIGHGCRAALAAALVLLALTGTAHAADPWRPVSQSCVSHSGSGGVCATTVGTQGLWKVAVAPGGTHAYGIAHESRAILLFDRNRSTGRLTPRSCIGEPGFDCAGTTALGYPNGIVISPDGANVYVSSAWSITVFDRNRTTGALTQKPGNTGCFTSDGRYPPGTENPPICTPASGIVSSTLLISPDGRHLYTGPNTLGMFVRDPSTGALSQPASGANCTAVNIPGCTAGRGVGAGRQMALSPDGRSLYAPNAEGNTLVILDRNPTTGLVRQKDGAAGCIGATAGCAPDPEGRMTRPQAITVSPDNAHVYVSTGIGMLVYARAADGRLTLKSCISDTGTKGCASGRNLASLSYSAISPDGQTIVAGNEFIPGMVILQRGADGNLAQPAGVDGCVTSTGAAIIAGVETAGQCHTHPALAGNGQITFIDDSNLIAGAHTGSAVTAFKRDLYPQCQNQSVAVAQNLAAALGLACADRNGDALTYAVTGNPIAGVLGAIDQAAARVFYNPFSGFTGPDSVRYQATAAGLRSNEATLSIDVVPPPPPPAPRPRTVNAPVSYNWNVKRSRLTLSRMIIRRLPEGATVTLRCSGKRCPFKTRTIKRGRTATLNVHKAKALRSKRTFRAGQTLDVRIAAPGMNTKMLRYKLRRGKVPKHRTYCVPLGATKAQRGSCA
jgi:DNA-binding beta-propeller fold protein YncE